MTTDIDPGVEWVDSVWYVDSWASCLTAFLYRLKDGTWRATVAIRTYDPQGHEHDDIEAYKLEPKLGLADPRAQMFHDLDKMARDAVTLGHARAYHLVKVEGDSARMTELLMKQPWCHLAEALTAAARKRGNVAQA